LQSPCLGVGAKKFLPFSSKGIKSRKKCRGNPCGYPKTGAPTRDAPTVKVIVLG
jgi:hypothetical protein